ncbi:MAG TPA: enolase C-terminal domain-like protein [Verrucomicrobiales bacterium]|nr:enolase C-terminal domain-like protein [Verrucomicrobiales bacterium]
MNAEWMETMRNLCQRETERSLGRRQILGGLGGGLAGGLGGALGLLGVPAAAAQEENSESAGPSAGEKITIRRVRAIATKPQGQRLVVVKVETSEPGLYGLGCATFNQRPLAVVTAVEKYLDPFARGRDVDGIEDFWQNAYTSSYWRNGPVLNNALSGVDMALWDIKGKRAGMPVYQLLGGKCRFAAPCYSHASGRDLQALEDSVREKWEAGFRHIRIQLGGYGSPHLSDDPDYREAGFGLSSDGYMESLPYLKGTVKMFEHVRSVFGDEPEFLHDVHERVQPSEAIQLLKDLERFRPFFIEDPVAPEANGWFPRLRAQTSTPIAMGELFNSPHEWVGLITERLIDFIRVHISQAGGLTPARKLAALAEWHQVRTAWHGPGDLSPVGHACNGHLDLAIPNFGIQESIRFSEATQEVFPGCPEVRKGYLYVNESPGFGVDINEELAAKYPFGEEEGNWEPVRSRDGSARRP